MTDIEKKALALVNEVRDERGFRLNVEMQREDLAQEALLRAIEQHEAYKREVSDAVEDVVSSYGLPKGCLARFIIAKPDPLVEALLEAFPGNHIDDARDECAKINAALAARGLTITETKEKN